MENKINIAKLLKDCPKGMELDCPMFDNLYFDRVVDSEIYSIRTFIESEGGIRTVICFTEYGTYSSCLPNSKCVIFPKGKTTWEEFVPPIEFKDGDILYTRYDCDKYIFIFESITENTHVNSYLYLFGDELRIVKAWLTVCDDKYLRLATEEEKARLFQAIKERGYKWNAETKTLENLPIFKTGDKIVKKNGVCVPILITKVGDEFYYSNTEHSVGVLSIEEQDDWELVPNKFDITTLKPFESRVLVRDKDTETWEGQFYSRYSNNSDKPYICIGVVELSDYKQCIPYEGNEHLLGTTNDCNEFYKTWENEKDNNSI